MINLQQYNYTGETPKPIFNTDFYSGQDYYSDGGIEDTIINLIAQNPTTDYEQLINQNFSWPVFYHLTRIRQNILNWYPFNKDCDILEIGCGMGAITELLCNKAKNVTAVELSQKRATATYLRCRNYSNLEIMVGNLNDIQFNKKYDYITLIGVLEYQIKFTDSSNPFVDFLNKIRPLLKPNGRLLIAIENKYGLKYWCGVPEDHSGIPFDGINNYNFSQIARTFSKKGLNKIITDSGFNHTYFYYPLPDYKMPQVIYSENYLPKNGSLDNWIPYYSNTDGSLIADETHIYKDIVDNNVFEFFANSFLVECSINNTEIGMIDYAVSSPFRKSEFDIITTHSSDNRFYKTATPNSTALLHNIEANHKALALRGLSVCNTHVENNILFMDTINGTPLTNILINAYKSKDINNVYKIYDKIYDNIKRSSESSDIINDLFNNITNSDKPVIEHLDTDDKILAYGFIDMIHKNCIVDSHDNYIWIDQEWCINDVPASYILFHNIVELHNSDTVLNSYIPIDRIFKHYNLTDKLDSYYRFKDSILFTVQNKYSAYNYKELYSINNKKIDNNIATLYNNAYKQEEIISDNLKTVNNILKNDTIEEMINYVSTLPDDVILNEMPCIPQFIVKYLNSDKTEQCRLNNIVNNYSEITNLL